jgi:ketosteroid isomerase-like protein
MNDTRQIVDNYYHYLKERDREKLLELLADDIVVTYHAQEGMFPWGGKYFGKEGFDHFFSIIKEYLNIIEVSVEGSIADESKLVNQCRGSWEYKASGHIVNGSMVNVFTVKDGKISAYDVYADTAAFAVGLPGILTDHHQE